MLRTPRHAYPGTQVARRPLALRARCRAESAATKAGPTGCPPGRVEMPVPASYNDVFPDADGARPRGRCMVRDHGSHPGALGRAADRAAVRLGHPSGGRVGQRHPGRRARGWLHAVRGRRHRRRRAGRRAADHGRRQQRAQLAVDPAGLCRARPRTARGSACSSTSSITRASTGRSGSAPRRART